MLQSPIHLPFPLEVHHTEVTTPDPCLPESPAQTCHAPPDRHATCNDPLTDMSTTLRYIFLSFLLIGTAVPSVWGHNGQLALAPALEGIVVDGDLSDWPRRLQSYTISTPAYGEVPEDDTDLAASMRVGYDAGKNHLLIAITVVDESSVLPPGANWDSADGVDVFLDVSHGRQPAIQLAYWGTDHTALGAGNPRFGVVMSPRPNGRVYEWWVDVASLGSGTRLEPGLDIAFDVAVADRDEDGSFSWVSWGPHANKVQNRDRLGDLLIVGDRRSFDETTSYLGDLIGRTKARAETEARRNAGLFAFLSGALVAVTFLHLLLFLFQRESRVNLYHAIFAGATCVAIGLAWFLPGANLDAAITSQVARVWAVVIFASSLLLLYAQFHGRVSRSGRWLLAWLAAAAGIRVALPEAWPIESPWLTVHWLLQAFAYMSLVAAFVTIGALVFGAVVRRRDGAWTVGVSFLVFATCAGLIMLRFDEGVTLPPWLLVGILLPLGSMSFRLARSVGAVHYDLARRYEEVERLSARLAEQNRTLELANIKIREGSRQVEEASRLKSAFLAHMSHDLRTPLNAIIGYTRIVMRRLRDEIDERQYRNLENIRVSADNLLSLINDILDLSRIESGRVDPRLDEVDIQRLTQECVATLQSLVPEDVELRTEMAAVPAIRSDGDRLRRVLMNLLGNALKYTEAGHIILRLQPDGQGIKLSIEDTGVGIPPEDLDHIFDEFRQVDRKDKKREGSGLGLAIVRRSIEMLGGTVTATSQVGEGSTFTVRLPASAPAPMELPSIDGEPGADDPDAP